MCCSINSNVTVIFCSLRLGEDPVTDLRVVVGGLIYQDAADEARRKIYVTKYEIHPEFQQGGEAPLQHDIALLFLKTSLSWTDAIRPICLSHSKTMSSPNTCSSHTEPVDNTCHIAGWGGKLNGLHSVYM